MLACVRLARRRYAALPSRPQEPDNCCGNGCQTCVWTEYFRLLNEYDELMTSHATPGAVGAADARAPDGMAVDSVGRAVDGASAGSA